MQWQPPTCAHDEAWGVVLGVHSARYVGVVCPAQVQVQVAVRLQGGERTHSQHRGGRESVPKKGRTEAKSTPVAFGVGRQGQECLRGVDGRWEEALG